MSKVGEVIAQQTKDPDMRAYNVRYELTEQAIEDGHRGSVDKLGGFGRLVLNIRGVELVRIQPYRFFVSKGTAFSWDEIEPKVIEILNALNSSQRIFEVLALEEKARLEGEKLGEAA